MFELLGIAGIAISMLAYLPQVVHLAREHCSAGVSRRAWTMWFVSSLLIGALAFHRHDLVFILLQISSLTSAAIILFLAQRYRGMVCETHARGYPRGVDGAGAAAVIDGPQSAIWQQSANRNPTEKAVLLTATRDFERQGGNPRLRDGADALSEWGGVRMGAQTSVGESVGDPDQNGVHNECRH